MKDLKMSWDTHRFYSIPVNLSKIRLNAISWLNDMKFQAKCYFKVNTGSYINAKAVKWKKCSLLCYSGLLKTNPFGRTSQWRDTFTNCY